MARDVEADVNIKDKSDGGLKSFLANLRKADDRVKSTQKGIDEAAKSTGKLGKTADENAKAFAQLSKELEISKKELGSLARAFAEADTAAERTDISKAVRKQQAEIRNLTKNRDILKDLLPSDGEVQKAGQKLTQQFKGIFSEVGDLGGPALAIGLAGASPLIGATIAGAVLGGAGVGGIVGGVALAARDSRVQSALAEMKTQIGKELTDAAQPFVSTTIDGIERIGGAVEGIDFKSIFSEASVQAGPIVRGVTDAVTSLGGAITQLLHNSGPVIDEIGDGIGDFGRVVSGGLKSLSDNGPEAAKAIADVLGTVNVAIEAAFGLVNGLTEVYGILNKIGADVSIFSLGGKINYLQHAQALGQQAIAGSAKAAAEAVLIGKTAADQYGQAILTDGDAIATFTARVDTLASAGQSLFNSTTQVGAAIDAVTAAAKKNGKTLDENTTKGRANRDALSAAAQALHSQYDAYVDVNGEGRASNAVAGQNREAFIKLAGQFGKTRGEAERLADQFGLIPAKKNTSFTANTHDAAARVAALKAQIAAVHGKTVTIDVKARTNSVNATLARLGGLNAVDAMQYFAPAQAGAGIQRSGGANPVTVDNQTNVTVLLDSREIRAIARSEAQAEIARANYRQKVGRR